MATATTNTIDNTNNAAFPRTPEAHQRAAFENLLDEALNQPGIISEAYRAFHNFSIGNQILATLQLAGRGLPLAPIASFKAWQDKGRQVQKGQKAIRLFMPVTIEEKDEKTGEKTGRKFQTFMLRPNWFSLDQTDGEAYVAEVATPEWSPELALQTLGIEEKPFEILNGNCQGYATGRTIAVNPLAVLPHKTRFHEIAHVVLGHTAENAMNDDDRTPRDIREVEAESVAYLLCSLLGLPGLDESRGYIATWRESQPIGEKSAKRIFGAADKILKAGKPMPATA